MCTLESACPVFVSRDPTRPLRSRSVSVLPDSTCLSPQAPGGLESVLTTGTSRWVLLGPGDEVGTEVGGGWVLESSSFRHTLRPTGWVSSVTGPWSQTPPGSSSGRESRSGLRGRRPLWVVRTECPVQVEETTLREFGASTSCSGPGRTSVLDMGPCRGGTGCGRSLGVRYCC